MDKIEGMTYQGAAPWMIWVFIIVGLALCAAIAAVWKVIQISREEKKRRKDEVTAIAQSVVDARANALAEEISQKVSQNMQGKFDDINRKLAADKENIEQQTRRSNEHDRALERIESTLNSVDTNIKDMREGFTYLARGTIATLNQQLHNGNKEELEKAANEMNRYLTSRPIVPMH